MPNPKKLERCPNYPKGHCSRKVIGKLLTKPHEHTPYEYYLCENHYAKFYRFGKRRGYPWHAVPMTNGEIKEYENT